MAPMPREVEQAQVAALIRGQRGRRVVLVTHESPDGDAVGSLLAAGHLLQTLGAQTEMVMVDPVPESYSFLPGAGSVQASLPPLAGTAGPDLLVYLDCAARERAKPEALGLEAPGLSLNIDHHASNTRYADLNWVLPDASSTGEMVGRLYTALGLGFGEARQALYVAIVADTGSFAYEGTTASTHRMAAALLEEGLDPGPVHQRLYAARPVAAVVLLARALASLAWTHQGRVADMTLQPADFVAAGALPQHTEGIVNYARDMAGVMVGLLFSTHDGREVRVGVRTRPGVDAHLIAARFGGGGHPRAAGCRLATSLPEARALVLAAAGDLLPGPRG